jgi:hypothetical protein
LAEIETKIDQQRSLTDSEGMLFLLLPPKIITEQDDGTDEYDDWLLRRVEDVWAQSCWLDQLGETPPNWKTNRDRAMQVADEAWAKLGGPKDELVPTVQKDPGYFGGYAKTLVVVGLVGLGLAALADQYYGGPVASTIGSYLWASQPPVAPIVTAPAPPADAAYDAYVNVLGASSDAINNFWTALWEPLPPMGLMAGAR